MAQVEDTGKSSSDFIDKEGSRRSANTLNENLASVCESFVGGVYLLGGESPSNEGGFGIDCSANPLLAAERVSGVSIKDRTANGILTDPMLVVPCSKGPGTMNGFDWKTTAKPNGDGYFDHITVNTNEGKEVHPSSTSGTINIIDKGSLDHLSAKTINMRFNWRYILGN